jgi:tRNA-uridine 2-sulfurtransferase
VEASAKQETVEPNQAVIGEQGITAPDLTEVTQQLEHYRGQRVAVAMSGGVDSAVAGLLLRRAGAEVIGLSLRLHDSDPYNPLAPRACCAPDDLADARHVAEGIDVPFYVIDSREEFEAGVVKPFVDEYLAGQTPNPCVGCNSFVKLGLLARRAKALGCVALATGHYARLRKTDDGRVHLFAGQDKNKDQSYFLFGTAPEILNSLLFPLGAHTKELVREEALSSKLPVAHKLESQEVCFVGGSGAGDYVLNRPEAAGNRRGNIIDASGNALGEHEGVARFTIGQRRGLGLGTHKRLYVLNIDAESREVQVGDEELLAKNWLIADRASWPAGAPEKSFRVKAKIRYRGRPTSAKVEWLEHGRVHVRFDEPVLAVAPGQAVVFYRGDEVIGGAWILESGNDN